MKIINILDLQCFTNQDKIFHLNQYFSVPYSFFAKQLDLSSTTITNYANYKITLAPSTEKKIKELLENAFNL